MIAAGELAANAVAVPEEHKITSLVVVDVHKNAEGILQLHDRRGAESI
jgi:hypothetical protein